MLSEPALAVNCRDHLAGRLEALAAVVVSIAVWLVHEIDCRHMLSQHRLGDM